MRTFLYWTGIAGLFLFISSCHHDPPIGFCKATLNGRPWKSDDVAWYQNTFDDSIAERISIGFSKQLGYSRKAGETSIGFGISFPRFHDRKNQAICRRKSTTTLILSDSVAVSAQSIYGDVSVYGYCRSYEVDTTATNYIRITGYNEESGEVYAEFEVTLISDDPCDKLYPKKLHFKDGQMTAVKR
jgi:hypothetical protein